MKHERLKLGIMGLSEGNGHPYSWSAIFNGYDCEAMKKCPFPVISKYLSKQHFPQDSIKGARVTHIWTQDRLISENIAKTCRIENIVEKYTDLIGEVDAILLARDDARSHYEMSAPFLKAGLPIYIDKPLALSRDMAEKIYSLEQYEGQVFTCSALSYAKEFWLNDEEMRRIGVIKRVEARTAKDWDKYGIHIIEPVLKIIGRQGEIKSIKSDRVKQKKTVTVSWESGLRADFSALGDTVEPVTIRISGTEGIKECVFTDTFFAFKKSLNTFIDVIFKRCEAPAREFVLNAVKIIEGGNHNG